MKRILKYLVFSCILIFYAFTYIATSKPCDDKCEQFENLLRRLRQHSYISYSNKCGDLQYCVTVDTSQHKSWAAVADTVCNHIKDLGILNYRVAIINRNDKLDTLAKQACQ